MIWPLQFLIVTCISCSSGLFLLGFTSILNTNIEGSFSPLKMLQNSEKGYFG